MIIIGEKINSTLKLPRKAMEQLDAGFIKKLAKNQADAGSTFLDVNAGMFLGAEVEKINWLIKTIEEVTDLPLCIDSPDPKAIEAGIKACKNKGAIINSITYEKKRWDEIIPIVDEYKAGVVALCMDDGGMPENTEQRVAIADRLISGLTQKGLKLGDIYIDPMVRPIGTGSHYGVVAIETIRKVKQNYPQVHIACGLSNISFGIPSRKTMNQCFLVGAILAGMDGAILDPLDKKLMSFVYAAEALSGVDDYCVEYITKFREGAFDE